jgi:hypothetical protein
MNEQNSIIVSPMLSEPNTLVIYRDNGEEVVVKIYKEKETMGSNKKMTIEEVNYIRQNYLNI